MGCYGYRENGVLLELHTLPHCKMHCFLVVGLEKVVFREENCQGNQNYEPIQLNTLLERLYAEIKKKSIVKPRKRRLHSIESDSDTD